MTVYILALARDSFLYIMLCLITIIQRKSATWPPAHRLVPKITKRLLRKAFFFPDGVSGDGRIEYVVIDNQIGSKTWIRATNITGLKSILR